MRGISPVITSTLLVLIAVLIVSVIYPWAVGVNTSVVSSMKNDVDAQTLRIMSDTTVILPPAGLTAASSFVVIHNSGAVPLSPFTVAVMDSNGIMITDLNITVIDLNGNVTTYAGGSAPQLNPGDVALVELPASPAGYYDWSVLISSKSYVRQVRWV